MTFDPTQHGGRTKKQVERNEEAAAYCLAGIGIATLVSEAMKIGEWLVATVAGLF